MWANHFKGTEAGLYVVGEVQGRRVGLGNDGLGPGVISLFMSSASLYFFSLLWMTRLRAVISSDSWKRIAVPSGLVPRVSFTSIPGWFSRSAAGSAKRTGACPGQVDRWIWPSIFRGVCLSVSALHFVVHKSPKASFCSSQLTEQADTHARHNYEIQ